MTENQKKLRELMANNKVVSSYAKLADFWGLSIHTVHAYLKPEQSKSHRSITDKNLESLKQKLSNHNGG